MQLKDIAINEFCELSSEVSKQVPARDMIADAVRQYDFVVEYTLDHVEVLDASGYPGLPEDFLELRAFNSSGELHIVDVGGTLAGRVRTDMDGSGSIVFDEKHLLWGRATSDDGDPVVLEEGRGTVVRLPGRALPGIAKDSCVTIRVRNYLDEGGVDPESGDTEFAFSDYRFVSFGEVKGGSDAF